MGKSGESPDVADEAEAQTTVETTEVEEGVTVKPEGGRIS